MQTTRIRLFFGALAGCCLFRPHRFKAKEAQSVTDNELGSWRFFPTTALNLRSSGGVIKRRDKRDAACR